MTTVTTMTTSTVTAVASTTSTSRRPYVIAGRLTRCLFSLVLVWLLGSFVRPAVAMGSRRMAELRRETVEMFYHGYDNYMRVAFPEDELRPVSCTPLTRDVRNPSNIGLNDVLGNYSLTLIDSLSTLAILASSHDVYDSSDSNKPNKETVGAKALRDFQDGVAALVQQYGDGRPGPSGQGERGRGFDVDSKVQVFETVIRGVGGLLSAHLFAAGELPIRGYDPSVPWFVANTSSSSSSQNAPFGVYDGQLLRLAHDLATRLLPAFYTQTGMPYPRVNLRHGIPFYLNSPLHQGPSEQGQPRVDETTRDTRDTEGGGGKAKTKEEITETCSAGAGSLVLEFTVLSRLTGDQRFEQLAKRAFWAVWYRRSDIGLIGAGVDAEKGRWIGPYSVIGAGADSFFEYALKTHILLSGQELPNRTAGSTGGLQASTAHWHDPNALFPQLSDEENSADAFLEAWNLAHAAIKRHLYSDRDHPHYVTVNIWTGSLASQWIDSLGAYYAGLLALAGELEEAVETNLLYTAVWTKYAALPERWSLRDKKVEGGLGWWPLRPEFIESTYHIFRATRDPWYLYVGEMVQRDIQRRCWTPCGWAGLQNVLDGEQTDRMESFFLGETAKYMYLLYDDSHPLNSLDAAYVFTTEGHPLLLPRRRPEPPTAEAKVARKPPVPASEKKRATAREVGQYTDDAFKSTCPVAPKPSPLTGSAVTARTDIYHAAKLLDLHLTVREVDDDDDDDDNNNNNNQQHQEKKALEAATFFPWTLPPSMLPDDGLCAKVQQPLEMNLEFASNAQDPNVEGSGGSGFNFHFMVGTPNLGRLSPDKIRVHSINGLKLLFRLDEEDPERAWRVTRVNGVPLGRDESIVVDRALLRHISDVRFRLVRDPVVVKLHHLHHVVLSESGEELEMVGPEDEEEEEAARLDSARAADGDVRDVRDVRGGEAQRETAALPGLSDLARWTGSIWRRLASSLDGLSRRLQSRSRRRKPKMGSRLLGSRSRGRRSGSGSVQSQDQNQRDHRERDQTFIHGRPIHNLVLNATGVTALGLGAAALPDVDTVAGAVIPQSGAVVHEVLPWSGVYAGGFGCEPLPENVSRDYAVVVLRRGGCSFSEKLASVPPVPPPSTFSSLSSSSSGSAAGGHGLQLVVIVSNDNDDDYSPDGEIHSENEGENEDESGGESGGEGGEGGRKGGSNAPKPPGFHDDADSFVRPLLDEVQRTPSGLLRREPVPMIMVGGGEETYRHIAAARQLGLTRRYTVESQGVRIRNILIDDGDED